jgi:hypothetical protein
MPSTPRDFSLAVGDGARRMTYAELAQARSISLASARRLARRHHWSRQVGNDGIVRVTVPLGQVESGPRPTSGKTRDPTENAGLGLADAMSHGTDPRTTSNGPRPDPGLMAGDPRTGPGTDPLAQAVETLREQLGIANRRIDELLLALADARTAALISGCEAATLRTQLALLTERRPWWRRWLR